MVELLLTWKGTPPVGRSTLRRVYRWGTSIGHFDLVSKSWNAEQRTIVQESPVLERCTPISRAAPPIIVDDAWEEIVTDHGNYQSIEGSLLQIRMSTTNYKEKLALAIRLGCPIDSSTQLICEKELLDEVRPLLPMLPTRRSTAFSHLLVPSSEWVSGSQVVESFTRLYSRTTPSPEDS